MEAILSTVANGFIVRFSNQTTLIFYNLDDAVAALKGFFKPQISEIKPLVAIEQ